MNIDRRWLLFGGAACAAAAVVKPLLPPVDTGFSFSGLVGPVQPLAAVDQILRVDGVAFSLGGQEVVINGPVFMTNCLFSHDATPEHYRLWRDDLPADVKARTSPEPRWAKLSDYFTVTA